MNFIRFSDLCARGLAKNQRVFIRADLNVPQDDAGNITEDTRIRASIPCVQMALDAGAAVMVTSHLGRPTEGEFKPEDSLAPVAKRMGGWPLHLTPVDKDGKPADPKLIDAWRYYDAMNFATRTKAEALFTVGFIDITCPPSGVYATYNQVKGKKDIVDFFHYGHIASPEGDAAVKKKVLEYIGKPPA